MSTETTPARRPMSRFTKILLAMIIAGTALMGSAAVLGKRFSEQSAAAARAARVEAGLKANEAMHGTGKDCPWNGASPR